MILRKCEMLERVEGSGKIGLEVCDRPGMKECLYEVV